MPASLVRQALLVFIVTMFSVIALDFISKAMIWRLHPEQSGLEFLHLVSFHLHQNTGMMLNIGSHLSVWHLVLISLAIATGITLFLLKYGFQTRALALAWGAVVGGALANIVDRMMRGAVTDFLSVDLYFFQTGIFNLADLCSLVGLVFIAFSVLFRNRYR